MSSSVRLSNMEKSTSVRHIRVEDETELDNMFSMGKRLGQGSFGIVREAEDLNSGKKWAVKAVNKERAGTSAVKLLEREVSILKRVNHDHIIHLEQVFETSKKMYLVMELCEHGELADMLKAQQYFKEVETIPIIRDLASAISYLHKNDIVHRDLKLENILVHKNEDSNDLHIKVTDFGLSVVKDGVGHENMMQQFCGTPIYMPPEIVDNKTYSQQCDVWAMGVITYYLLSGSPPFKARDEETLYDYIKKGEINFEEEHIKECSTAAHQCIQGMLKVDPAYRLAASEVLNHHWITGVHNGSVNVLELMRQFNDEATVDGDDDGDQTRQTQGEHPESADVSSKPGKHLSGKQSQQHITKSIKGTKPRSAGSKPSYSGNNNKLMLNHTSHRQHQITSFHSNRVSLPLVNNLHSGSSPNVTPIRRRHSPLASPNHNTPSSSTLSPAPAPHLDSSMLLDVHGTEIGGERDSLSAGRRGSPMTVSSSPQNKSSTSLPPRKKPEKSPPSQTIKSANKK